MSWGIYYEITNECNLRCKTCLPASTVARKGELSINQIIKFAYKLSKHGADSFYITGGEPMLYPKIDLLIDTLSKIGYSISVISNGYNLTPKIIEVLKATNTKVNVSLDGATKETNDFVRGDGSYDQAIKSIKLLATNNIPVVLCCTVTNLNFNELHAIGQIGLENNCYKVLYSEVVNGGRAKKNWDFLNLQEEQKSELPLLIEAIANELYNNEKFGRDENCWVDGSSLYINSLGNAYLCSEIYQQKPDLYIANINSEYGPEVIVENLKINNSHAKCCYGILSSENVALIYNINRACALI